MLRGLVLLPILFAGGMAPAFGSGYPVDGTGEIAMTGRQPITFSAVAEGNSVRFSVNYPRQGEHGGISADELETMTLEGPGRKGTLDWNSSGSGRACATFLLPKDKLRGVFLNLSIREHKDGKTLIQPRRVHLHSLWAWATAKDSIERLVAQLDGNGGMWQNGSYPIIELPADAPVKEVLKQVFRKAEPKILEIRTVRIDSEEYKAVSVEVEAKRKVVLLRPEKKAGSWWSRVWDADAIDHPPH